MAEHTVTDERAAELLRTADDRDHEMAVARGVMNIWTTEVRELLATRKGEQRLRRENERLRHELQFHAVQPEYDMPGDTPEIVGYMCHICMDLAKTEEEMTHHEHCPLARQALTGEAP